MTISGCHLISVISERQFGPVPSLQGTSAYLPYVLGVQSGCRSTMTEATPRLASHSQPQALIDMPCQELQAQKVRAATTEPSLRRAAKAPKVLLIRTTSLSSSCTLQACPGMGCHAFQLVCRYAVELPSGCHRLACSPKLLEGSKQN